MLGARDLIATLACAMLACTGAACSRQGAAPPVAPVTDAALARPAPVPPVVDAAIDHTPDAAPDGAGPPRPHAHRSAAPRPPAEGTFKIEGAISKADAQTVLAGARGRLDACYQKERDKAPGLKGRVTFRLLVDGRGRVPLAEVVSSTLGSGDPELCMVEALRDVKFPPSPSGAETTLTFPASFGR
jgi:hypothetical protein